MIEYFNEDCMAGMARYPDKHFDLAIDALMQQSEPTEPCYYCRDLDGVNCYQRGTLYRKGEEINSVPARYCMNCGRRIKP